MMQLIVQCMYIGWLFHSETYNLKLSCSSWLVWYCCETVLCGVMMNDLSVNSITFSSWFVWNLWFFFFILEAVSGEGCAPFSTQSMCLGLLTSPFFVTVVKMLTCETVEYQPWLQLHRYVIDSWVFDIICLIIPFLYHPQRWLCMSVVLFLQSSLRIVGNWFFCSLWL